MTLSVLDIEAAKERGAPYLLTYPLPAVLAFDSMFDDGVIGRPPINQRDSIQRDTDADEVEDFIDESTGSEKKQLVNRAHARYQWSTLFAFRP